MELLLISELIVFPAEFEVLETVLRTGSTLFIALY